MSDDHGSTLFAGNKNLEWTNILSAQVFALWKCLSQALEKGYRKVLIEGDLKILIENIIEKCDTS